MNYSFDYDNTLIKYAYLYDEEGNIIDAVYDKPHQENINLLRELSEDINNTIYIVTARVKGLTFEPCIDSSPKPEDLIRVLNLPVAEIVYTKNRCKLPVLVENNISDHWDDCPEQCKRINDSGLLKAWEVKAPPGINAFLKKKFIKLLKEQT
jgi:hypothetical protein